jgi:hypothetical protein
MKPALTILLSMLLASSVMAETVERLVDAAKVFPMLDKFLAIPPAERSRLILSYRVTQDGRPPADVHLNLIVEGRRTPLPIAATGQVERLPSAADFSAHAQVAVDAPKGAKLGTMLDLSAAIPSGQEITAADCALALIQGNAAIHRVAGVMAIMAPHLSAAAFLGAGSGVAVGADGQSRPLPLVKGQPVYDPAVLKDVKMLRLAKAPTRIDLQ